MGKGASLEDMAGQHFKFGPFFRLIVVAGKKVGREVGIGKARQVIYGYR